MARCFLRDAPILVLDEPTAHLDSRTEEDLSDAIARAAAGRTAIVVSHRNRPLETADRVLSMKAGRLEEVTSPSAGASHDCLTTRQVTGRPCRTSDPQPLEGLRALLPGRHPRGARRGRVAHDFRLPDQPRRPAARDPVPHRGDRRCPVLRDLAGALPLRGAADLPRPGLPNPHRPARHLLQAAGAAGAGRDRRDPHRRPAQPFRRRCRPAPGPLPEGSLAAADRVDVRRGLRDRRRDHAAGRGGGPGRDAAAGRSSRAADNPPGRQRVGPPPGSGTGGAQHRPARGGHRLLGDRDGRSRGRLAGSHRPGRRGRARTALGATPSPTASRSG